MVEVKQKKGRQSVRSSRDLAAFLGLPGPLPFAYRELLERYPFRASAYYLSLIRNFSGDDPIYRQCIPDLRELSNEAGKEDPLEETKAMPVENLIHRYPDRCLLIMTTECFVYCRHCNRKRWWKKGITCNSKRILSAMLNYISVNRELREVILSGGDPLTLNDEFLDWFLGRLREVSHVEIIRLGSRAPVVAPRRITNNLCKILKKYRPLWFNTQFNHPQELTAFAKEACEKILTSGIPLANQSVLLKGINDDYETMKELVYGLQRLGVKPYYLFQCDAVLSTKHFWVDVRKGIEIMERLKKTISGLCLPTYVLDSPSGKIHLGYQGASLAG